MKRIFSVLVALAIAVPSFAGITYRFTTTVEGTRESAVSGVVKSDGPKGRVEITSGDEMIFRPGSVILSSGNSVITVFDPAKKTYYELDLEKYLRSTVGGQSPIVSVDVLNPHVSVRELGAGPMMLGYPTHRARLVTSFELAPKFAGQLQMQIGVNLDSEVWLTDKLPAAAANVLQSSRLRTGVPAIDKMIDSSAVLRGFPLKQVTTSKITVGGSTSSGGKSTTVVSDVRETNLAPDEFSVPAGFTKIDDPLEAMLKNLGMR
ncbi:MAG TPA: hypothetical protein VLV78_08035 [Thermoanaerobaculia bacterium]|nr:hypothetical protein [Thermoanaerobaculia bacterium]